MFEKYKLLKQELSNRELNPKIVDFFVSVEFAILYFLIGFLMLNFIYD